MKRAQEAVTIRPQMVKDAKGFYQILTQGNFRFFPVNVASIEAERRFLRKTVRQWKAGETWNFAIMLGDRLIGAIGVMPEDGRPYCAEIGYFIEASQHGRGYALQAVRLVEEYILPTSHRSGVCLPVWSSITCRVPEWLKKPVLPARDAWPVT